MLKIFSKSHFGFEFASLLLLFGGLAIVVFVTGCATPPLALNQASKVQGLPAVSGDSVRPLAERLRLAALSIRSRFGGTGKKLDYKELIQSPQFVELKAIASELRQFDLSALKSKNDKISFWINIYNSLVIQGIAEQTASRKIETVWDIGDFFGNTAYEIGGYRFSLNDIENGILRANRRRPYGFSRQFSSSDPRLQYSVPPNEFDPRIHFALNCGSASCPPFAFYKSDDLDHQLETAKCGFVTSDSIVDGDEVKISKIFDWYSGDFKPSVREFILTCAADDIKLKQALESPHLKLKFSPYNWHLNQL